MSKNVSEADCEHAAADQTDWNMVHYFLLMNMLCALVYVKGKAKSSPFTPWRQIG